MATTNSQQRGLDKQFRLHLISGGAYSGKSVFANSLIPLNAKATVIGTADCSDPALKGRIEVLASQRPNHWVQVSAASDLLSLLKDAAVTAEWVIVDSVSQWFGREIADAAGRYTIGQAHDSLRQKAREFRSIIQQSPSSTSWIIVTADVGGGMSLGDHKSQVFREILGEFNQQLAEEATQVTYMIHGIPQALKNL